VARTQPEKILKEWVNPATGLMDYQGRNLAFGLGWRATRSAPS
jgi:succinyl-CoA synthetase beta subunit